ncbi:hypothetical protein L2E82_18577 [Cichorium intybus]|uniref:Uncharacterized protein n=1 Tax=Cichorium intybus TaxID=13427 RepID=A0ACB9F9V1_CICIN|nr:hypothetical protein L1887_35976 [Cichorium endivia]KAI3768143.1 hypothetical protein L2E82_18577 [Cichorium intybus]
MERFLTSSVDVNKVWRRRSYDVSIDDSPDRRKNMKTVQFGESHGPLSKIKKMFNKGSNEKASPRDKKAHQSGKVATSAEFQSRLLLEIHKNTSSSYELGSTM